jgi:RNA polymerase sigma factor (sigma-70 family)
MEGSDEFDRLMRRFNDGSDPAAQQLYEQFNAAVRGVVRRKLPRALRPKFDSQDFVQEAWAEFWARSRQLYDFHHPDQFAAFMMRLAENIVADAVRQRILGVKYNVSREQSLPRTSSGGSPDIADGQLTPSQIVMRDEEWEKFLARQPVVYRRVFILYREGKDPAAIARALGISRRNVDRILARAFQEPETDSQS